MGRSYSDQHRRCTSVLEWQSTQVDNASVKLLSISAYYSVTFEGLPHDQARYSMAYFCGANNDTVLQPLVSNVASEKLIGWDGKPIGSVTAGEYYTRMFDDLYAGLSPGRPVAAS